MQGGPKVRSCTPPSVTCPGLRECYTVNRVDVAQVPSAFSKDGPLIWKAGAPTFNAVASGASLARGVRRAAIRAFIDRNTRLHVDVSENTTVHHRYLEGAESISGLSWSRLQDGMSFMHFRPQISTLGYVLRPTAPLPRNHRRLSHRLPKHRFACWFRQKFYEVPPIL